MFGDILKKLRKNHKVTQVQLAAALNLDKSTVAKYETAGVMPSPEVIIAIAKFFSVSTDYLLNEETSDTTKTTPSNDDYQFAFSKLTGDSTELTEDDVNDVKNFVAYIKDKRKKAGDKN